MSSSTGTNTRALRCAPLSGDTPSRANTDALTHAAGLATPSAERADVPPEDHKPLRVAILDRDSGFVVVLLKRLQLAGCHSTKVPASASARTLAAMDVDAVIVDLAVLGSKRWSWLGRLCKLRPDLSVVVCSHSSNASERTLSLRLGADDWLTKPCHPVELVTRMEAATGRLRRNKVRDLRPMTVGEVEIRPDQYQAFIAGRSLRLTLREYHVLELLARGRGEIQRRESVYEVIWGREMTLNGRSVDVCVHKLRSKLEAASPAWRYIHTHYRVGYRLAAEPVGDVPVLEPRAPDGLSETSLAA